MPAKNGIRKLKKDQAECSIPACYEWCFMFYKKSTELSERA